MTFLTSTLFWKLCYLTSSVTLGYICGLQGTSLGPSVPVDTPLHWRKIYFTEKFDGKTEECNLLDN